MAHERAAAERELGVHEVVVDRHVAEILPRQRDGFVLHLEVERRLRRREFGLLLLAVRFVVILLRRGLALDLVELRADFGEKIPPARDRMPGVVRRDAARLGEVALVEIRVAPEVVVLDFCRQCLRIHGVETRERLLHAILQEELIRHAHAVHRVELRLVREDGEQVLVLTEHRRVCDAALVAEHVRALVHERAVFEVLVGAALDRIDRDELRRKERAASAEEVVAVLQEFAQRGRVIVDDRVAVDHGLPHVPRLHHADQLFEKVAALPATPRDAFEVQRLDIVLRDELEHVRVRAVLRDVVPRRLVELRELRDDVELKRLRRSRAVAGDGDIHRVVRELHPGARHGGEVEVIFERLRRVRLQPQAQRIGRLAGVDRQRALRDLQEHLGLHGRAGRVRHHDVRAVNRAGEEFLRDVFFKLLVALLPVAVALPEEALRDEELTRVGLRGRGGFDLLMIHDRRAARGEEELPAVRFLRVLRCVKRQIEHGKREHHLAEIAAGLGDVRRDECALRAARDPRGVVAPECVHRHEIRVLLIDGQAVVVVLRPFLRRADLPIVGAYDCARFLCGLASDEADIHRGSAVLL